MESWTNRRTVSPTAKPAHRLLLLLNLQALAFILAAPYLLAQRRVLEPGMVYYLLSFICPQVPQYSFFFYDFPLAVCARCIGGLVGFLGGLFIYQFVTAQGDKNLTKNWFIFAAALPLLLDLIFDYSASLPSLAIRFLTGFILGAVLPFYLVPILTIFLGLAHYFLAQVFATRASFRH